MVEGSKRTSSLEECVDEETLGPVTVEVEAVEEETKQEKRKDLPVK